MALLRAKLGVSLFRHPCRKPLPLGKGLSVGLPPSPCLGLRPKQGRFGCLPKVLHDAKPTEQATLNTHFQKLYRFFDRLRRVTAYRAYARDNPLMRFICLRLLYHKSNRRKPTRRYAVLLPVAKGFDDKMSSDRRVTAYRAFARDNPLMRFICLRLLYHTIPFKPLPKWVK